MEVDREPPACFVRPIVDKQAVAREAARKCNGGLVIYRREVTILGEPFHRPVWDDFDGERFQDLVVDLLRAEGYVVEPSGVGPDKGVDAFATQMIKFGYNNPEAFVWAVQCKYKRDPAKSVSPAEVGEIADIVRDEAFLSKGISGFFLATNARLSTNMMSRLRGITRHGFKTTYWDLSTIQDVIDRRFKVYSKYFWPLIEERLDRRSETTHDDPAEKLAELLNDENVREADLAAFFAAYPEVLVRAVGTTGTAYSQIPLTGDGGRTLLPDFVIDAREGEESIIVELKSPNTPLVGGRRGLAVPSSTLQLGAAQLREYRNYFLDADRRKWARAAFGIDVYRPAGLLIVGRGSGRSTDEAISDLRDQLGDIRLMTYDQIVERLRRQREQ